MSAANLKLKYNINQVEDIAKRLVKLVNSKILLMHGDIGVGKTTLVKALAKVLGCNDTVSSPSYSIVNEYKIENSVLYHIDLYRLNTIEEAYDIGIEDYIYTNNWIIIEWPTLIKPNLPKSALNIYLKHITDEIREISLKIE